MNTNIFITPEDWENGKYNLPPVKKSSQNYLRSKKKVKYTKSARNVIYKITWIHEYLEMNTIEPKAN
jgi:hypothetical protein